MSNLGKGNLGIGNLITGRVEQLVNGGEGLLRIEGKVVFVAGVAPDEEVEIRIIQEKRDWARAALVRILSPSALRIEPRCRHFGRCGGCQLQHLPYSEQLRLKEGWARETLSRLQTEPITWLPTIAADMPWEYREKIQLHAAADGRWGFLAARSHDVVAIEECPITNPALIARLAGMPAGRLEERREISLQDDSGFVERVVEGLTIRTPLRGFVQIHAEQNARLVSAVLQLAAGEENFLREALVWDLYAGSGNLSLPLARQARQVWAVEGNGESARLCEVNAERNAIQNLAVMRGDVESCLPLLEEEGGEPDLIVLDPPREGAKTLMDRLPLAARVIYVSCDLASLKRDLSQLIKRGFSLEKAVVIDLFPQTHHVETVVALSSG